MQITASIFVGLASLALVLPSTASASKKSNLRESVYVMNNSPNGNRIQTFRKRANGTLKLIASRPTGGLGAGDNAEADPLGGQDSIITSDDGRFLYAVNAGSDNISVFFLPRSGRPILLQVVSSQGDFPVSLTSDGEFLYALNAGSDGSITGYEIQGFGILSPIAGSTRTLGTGQIGIPAGPARNIAPGDIAFDRLQRRLLIPFGTSAELGEGQLLAFSVDDAGVPSQDMTTTISPGRVPFSVDFTRNGFALVAEAFGEAPISDGGSVSSLDFGLANDLSAVNTVNVMQAATCWVRAGNVSDLVFSSNTNGGSLSSMRASRTGELSLLDSAAASGIGAPVDFDLSDDDEFLYVTTSTEGGVRGFRVNPGSGQLTDIGLFEGLPTFANNGYAPQGLAIR